MAGILLHLSNAHVLKLSVFMTILFSTGFAACMCKGRKYTANDPENKTHTHTHTLTSHHTLGDSVNIFKFGIL